MGLKNESNHKFTGTKVSEDEEDKRIFRKS